MSAQAVIGEGAEDNKGENARMASFVGALAIGTFLSPIHHYHLHFFRFQNILFEIALHPQTNILIFFYFVTTYQLVHPICSGSCQNNTWSKRNG